VDDTHPFAAAPGGTAARSRWRWRSRAALAPADRRRILAELYPEAGRVGHWWFRFAVMLALSVVIAVLGLSMNSDAVIIGAMLIAPLMTPLIGTAAALVMAWPRRLAQSALAVLAGSAGAVGISFVLTWLLPAADRVLTPAVLSRTSPDLRDLVVALAAGAAGAYATAREDVSAALPGVAVAVALVPPLAATGFTLAVGRADLAGGAFLLFAANLVAIVLVGAVVLVASGFVPAGRLRAASGPIRLGLLAGAAALVAVAVPLTAASAANARHAQLTEAVNQAVVTWLAPDPALTLTGASISGSLVTVEVTGSASPPSTTSLAQALTALLGPGAAVQVRWFQTTTAAASRVAGSSPLTLAQLRPLVQSWLAKTAGGASSMRIVQLASSGNVVSVELAGPSAPPPATTLAQAISKRAGRTVTVSVSWQTTAAPAPSPPSGAQQARAVAATWLSSHPGLDLLDVSLADGTATIDLAGTQPPPVTAGLRTALETKLGPDVTIVIRFTRLTVLTPAPAASAGSG
jgi:uncharacterized hydrophobic protein (TIGR00271 family)